MSLLYELTRVLVVASAALASVCWLVSRHPTTTDPFEEAQTLVVDLDWSADGQTLFSRSRGNPDCGARLWLHSVGDGPAARRLPTGGEFVLNAALLPDASAALLLGASGVLWRSDLRSHVETDLLEIPAPFEVSALAVSSDGAVFAVAVKYDVLLCDSHSGRELVRLADHSSRLKDVIFSDDGGLVVTTGDDGTIRIWNRGSGECKRVLTGPMAPVVKVEFVEGNQLLASVTAERDASIYLWDTATSELLWRERVDRYGLRALAVSPDGALAATGGHDRTVDLWDLRLRVRSAALSGHRATIRALRFSPDGATLASAAEDGTIRFWNLATRALVRTIDVGKAEPKLP